ncbi:MAG: phosphate transport system substrate-binding protein [Ignavibacteria bacterium]|nr:MAG: phosphate transport system substrate-binding protein [Ignavibacteria bacterium]KAF0160895.1 MAG: phosphate transport system substrate-binding protein [Ignavibacteria bacterium]
MIAGGCTFLYNDKVVIKIKGSETMLILTNRLALEYSKENPKINFVVEAGGTAAGFKALVANEIMISTASRNLEPEEIKLVSDKYGSIGVSTSIAKDALCIYVNRDNPLESLTIQEIKKIFLGQITNWNELGWIDNPINVYLRNGTSGTLQLFQKLVLENEQFVSSSKQFNSNESLQQAVANDIYSITFSGFVKNSNCKIVSIENISPDSTNVLRGYYPLSRYLHLYTLKQPEDEIKKFINWVLSPKGQNIIEEEGFYALFNYSLD